MLARSSASMDPDMMNVVESTAAIIFLGTPHRGSPDLAVMGEYVRSIVSTLGMETTPAILDALGLKTTDLERAQEEFSRLWQKYDFRVKTFQEGLAMSGIGLSGLGLSALAKKVVPDYSSSIGDHRERSETLQANHKELCRFSGDDDANYRKVAGELRLIYLSIVELNTQMNHLSGRVQNRIPGTDGASSDRIHDGINKEEFSITEKAYLESLRFQGMYSRLQRIEKPAEKTCSWLFQHGVYQAWINGDSRAKHHGFLWLKGKPGTGKSTLMKEAFHRAVQEQAESDYCAAAFFFSAKGSDLERSPAGLLRSLLHQLLPKHRTVLKQAGENWMDRTKLDGEKINWEEEELKSVFKMLFTGAASKKTFIFIDALDECHADSIREQAYFWRGLTLTVHSRGGELNVCLSSRHFPAITLSNCAEITVEQHNELDIATYLEQRLELGMNAQDSQWRLLRDRILEKSAGVFLWVVLVVDGILRNRDEGMGTRFLLTQVDVVPDDLEKLFSQMLSSLNAKEKQLTKRLFEWAILAVKPLRLHEWHNVLAFIRQPAPASLSEWRASDNATETDEQLERQIRSISRGLVEVRKTATDETQDKTFDTISICAGAGSLDFEQGETRVVQVVHESVREYFLQGPGFHFLGCGISHFIGNCHLSIMATCLDYLDIRELDALVHARSLIKQRDVTRRPFIKPSKQQREKARRRSFSRASDSVENQEPTGDTSHIDFVTITIRRRDMGSDHGARPTSQDSHSAGREYSPPGSQEAERQDGQRHPHLASEAKDRPEETPSFDMLSNYFDQDPGIDVDRWMEVNKAVFDLMSVHGSEYHSLRHSSVSAQSQVLEDYPALLSYAAYEFLSHARMAEIENADPTSIITRLQQGGTWARLVTLREDLPSRLELYQCALTHGLRSWLPILRPDLQKSGRPRKKQGYGKGTRSGGQSDYAFGLPDQSSPSVRPPPAIHFNERALPSFDFSTFSWKEDFVIDSSETEEWPKSVRPEPSSGGRRRQGSIASFGSAGSHLGRRG